MSSDSRFRPPAPSSRRDERVPPVAVLAGRWHLDYALYAQVLQARAQYVLCASDRTAEERAQAEADASKHAATHQATEAAGPHAAAEGAAEAAVAVSPLRSAWSRALASLRGRRAASPAREAAYQRAS